jgi:hypothetical protein
MAIQGNSQSKQSFSGRLVRWVLARQQRKANRHVLDALRNLPKKYRDDFVIELERRLLGQ